MKHNPRALSNAELIAEVKNAASDERRATAALIALIAELEERQLFLGEGCGSLFVYCTRVLRLSEHAAYGRIAAARASGYEAAASKAELFEQADVLVLMVRLVPATRGIVGAEDLAHMKSTALFVNTARAELVAPGALAAALKRGRPGLAAVDVYENEPVTNGDHPLLKLDNALCTPHTAWLEPDTYESYFGEAFDNILAYLSGRPVNLVNPEVLTRQHA